MLTKTLAAIAALSMLVAGGEALAAQKKSATVIGPKQPIPYAQLDAYLKASPKARASKDWWAGSAMTGSATDTSATTSATTMPSTDTSVNPAPSAAPPSMPVTPPTDATPQPTDPAQSSNPAPGAPASPPVTPPTEPK